MNGLVLQLEAQKTRRLNQEREWKKESARENQGEKMKETNKKCNKKPPKKTKCQNTLVLAGSCAPPLYSSTVPESSMQKEVLLGRVDNV